MGHGFGSTKAEQSDKGNRKEGAGSGAKEAIIEGEKRHDNKTESSNGQALASVDVCHPRREDGV